MPTLDERTQGIAQEDEAMRRGIRSWRKNRGPSLYDTSRAVWADEEISDLVWYLKGYGVEGLFAELEAEGLM